MDSIFEPNIPNASFPFKLGVMNGAQSFLYHWHDEVEILYGLDKLTTIGVADRPYYLNESDIIVIGAGENHCLFPSESDARRLAILFNPSFFFLQGAFSEHRDCFSKIKRHSSEWSAGSRELIKSCLSKIYSEYFSREPGWREAITAQLLRMAVSAIRDIPKEDSERSLSTRNGILKQIFEYLSQNYLSDMSLKSCADALGFNESYLSTMFKKHTGASFHQYLLNLRLKKAEWLLINSDMPIIDVSESSGFSSTKTFHRAFRNKYGISPGSFRSRGADRSDIILNA